LGGLCPKCLARFSFIELFGEAASAAPNGPAARSVPRGFGDYENLEEIARGGMGVVYRARQTSLHRTVALKMVAPGQLASPSAVRRFKTEAEAAANLDHPNIVPIYEIGEWGGRHYFTMKLVEGASLAQRLPEFTLAPADLAGGHRSALIRSQAQKLAALLAKVADAVHYAHQRGILHRDLKPGNILIDESGQPHVTDFGLAKRVEADSHLTLSGEIMGTPAYMAPEQAAGNVGQVTTAADVFSLGVILYQLLTGRLPFPGATPVEMLHAVIHHESPAPRALNALAPRDLETICLKCLEKEPGKRYGSAREVADELDRFVHGEPIQARPVSQAEKLWRWSRRNPALAGFAAATLVLLLTVAVGAPIAVWREARLRRQAQAEANKSQQVAQFLKDMLEGVGPSVARGEDTKLLREILDKTAKRVGEDLNDQPEVEADLRSVIGEVYRALGDYAKAEEMQRKALDLRRRLYGNEHLDVAGSLTSLGLIVQSRQRPEEAVSLQREAVAILRKLLGDEHAEVAIALNNLASALGDEGKLEEAERLHREVVAMRRKLLGDKHEHLAGSLANLGLVLQKQGRPADAEPLLRQGVEMLKELQGNDSEHVATVLNNLALALADQRKWEEAEQVHREVLEMRRRLLGEKHPYIAGTLHNLAWVREARGDAEEAETLCRQALAMQRELFGDDNLQVVASLGRLAILLQRQGKLEEAEDLLREALTTWEKLQPGKEHPDVAAWLSTLGLILQSRGQLDEAERLQRQAVSMFSRLFGGGHLYVATARTYLGAVLEEQGRLKESQSEYDAALEVRRKLLPGQHPAVANSLSGLARVLCAQGKYTDAEPLARECLAIRTNSFPDDWVTFSSWSLLGATLLGQGEFADAEPLLLAGYEGMKRREDKIPAAGRVRVKEALGRLAQFYESTGDPGKAARWKRKLADFKVGPLEGRPADAPRK